MIYLRLAPVLLGLLLVLPAFAQGTGDAVPEVNEYCPVWPDRLATAEYELDYRGHTVRFCCSTCLRLFRANPGKYVDNVPQLAGLREAGEKKGWRQWLRWPSGTRPQVWLFAFLGLLVITLMGAAARRRRREQTPSRLHYEVVLLLVVALGSGLGLGHKVLELETEARALRYENHLFEIEWLMHNNTYIDYGDPPIPARPPVGPRLESAYYRGNDERSPLLFNGGNYLTSLFRLSLRDSAGRRLRHGDAVEEGWLEVGFEIERAPHTPDAFWTEDVMGVIFLTRQTDHFLGLERPVEDRVDLTELEPRQRWEALFPIARVDGTGAEDLQGVIYVADEWRQYNQLVGATLHYALQYEIRIEDGRIAASSDLWMGSLFRPRKSPVWKVAPEEWLSHEPIPPLPAPGVEDPELLGLTDYYEEPELPEPPG